MKWNWNNDNENNVEMKICNKIIMKEMKRK